jgi:hypothetical protein
MWHKLFVRLQHKSDETILSRRFLSSMRSIKLPESNILQNIPRILKDFVTKTWQLLYRGTRDGFGSANFHSKCHRQSNTVTIILTTAGYIFGGFTPIAWDSGDRSKADNTGKGFFKFKESMEH